jgi:hypothetical protein
MQLKVKTLIASIAFLGIGLTGNVSAGFFDNVKPETLKIYPNPVIDGTISITSDNEIERIEILSIVGQVVYTQELEPSNSVRLNIDQIQSGIYLIKVTYVDNTSDTKRIWVK